MTKRVKPAYRGMCKSNKTGIVNNVFKENKKYEFYYAKSNVEVSNASQKEKVHPTQKPVALLEYLIKTYTNEGDLVLNNCAGSMSTVIASTNTNRNCIAIEKDKNYFEIGKKKSYWTFKN